ncbi:MAG: Major Facilitator Superfamily protein [Lentisphaerae bacterium ADurb.Bin242]|nr:MAG: Major Facilitator Superfamily protein [Lentisphaerae bacterium ADurb.Bin242]
MGYAAQLTGKERRKARFNAIASAWCGCVSELMLDGNAIIILYITMLGGDDTFSMFSTSITGIAYVLLLIPSAGLSDRIGLKRSNTIACYVGAASFVGLALVPLAGPAARYLAIGFIFLYCLSRPLYVSVWFPLLDNFLRPADRGRFFSRMRFSYMILNTLLFFGLGLVMGKNPPVWILQVSIAIGGLLVLGRLYFMNKLPVDPKLGTSASYDLKKAFDISVKNAPLVGFSIYSCFLSAAVCSTLPLSIIYLKNHLKVTADIIMIITAVSMAALIVGYYFSGTLLRKLGTKRMVVLIHVTYMLVPFGLFFCNNNQTGTVIAIAALQFVYNYNFACFNVLFASEMLALARPGNKTMAMAFCNTFSSGGAAMGRIVTSLLLGSGMLASEWMFRGTKICYFQSMFLIYSFSAALCLLLLFLVPAVVPRHEDYYEPN